MVTLVLPEQRREMTRLMADAGISPQTARIKSSDEELSRITGAREPSGVAVTIEVPEQAAQQQRPRQTQGRARSAGGGRRGGQAREGGRTGQGGQARQSGQSRQGASARQGGQARQGQAGGQAAGRQRTAQSSRRRAA